MNINVDQAPDADGNEPCFRYPAIVQIRLPFDLSSADQFRYGLRLWRGIAISLLAAQPGMLRTRA